MISAIFDCFCTHFVYANTLVDTILSMIKRPFQSFNQVNSGSDCLLHLQAERTALVIQRENYISDSKFRHGNSADNKLEYTSKE
jgi:hypothetical protein